MAPRLGGALGEAAVLGTVLLVCLFLAAAGRRRCPAAGEGLAPGLEQKEAPLCDPSAKRPLANGLPARDLRGRTSGRAASEHDWAEADGRGEALPRQLR